MHISAHIQSRIPTELPVHETDASQPLFRVTRMHSYDLNNACPTPWPVLGRWQRAVPVQDPDTSEAAIGTEFKHCCDKPGTVSASLNTKQ